MKRIILYVWLQLALGLCNKVTKEVLSRFSDITEVYKCEDFSFLDKSRDKYAEKLKNKDTSAAFEIMKRCERLGVTVTGYYDELYPKSLREIDNPPAVLYSIGNFKNLDKIPTVAIVGTRDMSDYGRDIAERFAFDFAKSEICVVSGLAKGVDTAAHRGAIRGGGYTVAVLGTPIGDIYPRENENAFKTLYERGLVLSEHYPGAPRTRWDFPNRNRIISAISDGVVIAEAGEKSGALITARYAMSQGKKLFAVPGAIGAENAGTNKLIKTGVPAVTSPSDVLEFLLLEYPEHTRVFEPSATNELYSYGTAKKKIGKPKESSEKPSRTNQKSQANPTKKFLEGSYIQRVCDALREHKELTADELVIYTELPVDVVWVELTMLEIEGRINMSAGGRFSLK